MNWQAFERDRSYVLSKLREGVYDSMENVTRVVETQFFQSLLREGDLQALASEYPTPRKREDVPLWVYLSSELALRLNASHGFKSLPYVLPCSGLRDALGPERVTQKRTAEGVRDSWKGFNRKNAYARESPCDCDTVRKLAKDTAPGALQAWHNSSVARYYGSLGAYDADGIFIADGTYLFVPNNRRYEGSDVLIFDEHNHPVDSSEIESWSTEAKLRLHRERCYRKVSLLHTTWERDFYVYTGVRVTGGRAGECPQLRPLVDSFVAAVGKGVMKVLIHDRGFIDGATVAHNKRTNEVDTIFPLKKNMNCWEEAWCLADLSQDPWEEVCPPESVPGEEPPVRPEFIRRRERSRQATLRRKKASPSETEEEQPQLVKTSAKAIRDLRIWDSCDVPIHAIAMRDEYDNGEESRWVLATTMDFEDVFRPRQYYQLRPTIEERIRQTKCFWDLTKLRSTDFALVVNQVVFVLMAYSLVQIFLLKTGRKELARRVRTRLFDELMHQEDQFAIYCDRRVAFLPHLEYHEILLTLDDHARREILRKTRETRAQKMKPPEKPWRP